MSPLQIEVTSVLVKHEITILTNDRNHTLFRAIQLTESPPQFSSRFNSQGKTVQGLVKCGAIHTIKSFVAKETKTIAPYGDGNEKESIPSGFQKNSKI